MKFKLIIAAIAASLLGGCVVVPVHGHHRSWNDGGWHGHHGWRHEGYRYRHHPRRW